MISITQDEELRYQELQIMAFDFARHGKTYELSKMIDSGLNVDLCDNKGNTFLMLASYNNQEEVVSYLIKNNASIDKRNDRGQTPLAGVCFKGYFNIVKILVENGADKYADNGMGTTPIIFSSIFGHKEIYEYLTNKKANKFYSLLISSIFYVKSLFK